MQRMTKLNIRIAILPAIILSLAAAQSAKASTWTGTAGDSQWTTAGNWSPSGVPGYVVPLLLSNASGVQLNASESIAGIEADNGSLTLTGSTGTIALGYGGQEEVGGTTGGGSASTNTFTLNVGANSFETSGNFLTIGEGGATGIVNIAGGAIGINGSSNLTVNQLNSSISGYGNIVIGANQTSTNQLVNNGTVTASTGTLKLSNGLQVSGSGDTSGAGWFATSSGVLNLGNAYQSANHSNGAGYANGASGTFIWGGQQTLTASTLNLVNQAAVSYTSGGTNANFTVTLKALNLNTDTVPGGVTFLDYYNIAPSGTMKITGLTIDYATLNLGYSPTIYEDESGSWTALSTSDSGNYATYTGGASNLLTLGSNFALGITETSSPVPEPSTYALLLGGMVALGFIVRRRQAKV